MSDAGVRPASEAVVRSLTEDELARWHEQRGDRLVRHAGRYWKTTHPGFYEPLHWFARLAPEQATRPAACLGFRAVLDDGGAAAANAALPTHVLSDVAGYGPHVLSSNRRYHLRKAQRLVEMVALTSTGLLEEQGHEIAVSALGRTGYARLPTRTKYVESLREYGVPDRRTVLAGLVNGKLVGYLDGWAADGTAYIEHVHVATSALPTNVNTGLVFAFVEACQRGGEVNEVVYGLHTPEDESLVLYKERLGFPARRLPARVWLLPGLGAVLRRVRPFVAYRITGRE